MQKGTPGSSLTWSSTKPKVQGLHPPFKTCQEGVLSQGEPGSSVTQGEEMLHASCFTSHELMLTLHERKNSHLHPSFLQQD